MDLLLGILLGIFVLTFLVSIHEFGHGVVARRNGVKVEEFGIGFPPKVAGKKITHSWLGNNVEYSLNWLPLGGFVRLKGEYDSAEGKNTYGNAHFWQKTKILLAGVTVNWIAAAILFMCLAWSGIPKFPADVVQNQFTVPGDTTVVDKPVQISAVMPGLPADAAGLKTGDQLIRFDGQKIASTAELTDAIKQHAGKQAVIIYNRAGKEQQTTVTIRGSNDDHKGHLGAELGQPQLLRSTWSAPIMGIGTAVQFTGLTFQGLGSTLSKAVSGFFGQFSGNATTRAAAHANLNEAGQSVAGPVGIFGVIFPAAEKGGFGQIVFLTAVLSIALAVMNVLPIPGLDGGRWFLTAIFKLMRKPLTEETEAKINSIGFMILMLLVVLVTIADIGKFK